MLLCLRLFPLDHNRGFMKSIIAGLALTALGCSAFTAQANTANMGWKKAAKSDINWNYVSAGYAKATIKNDIVIVQSNKVKEPVKVRFAWSNTSQTTLVNKSNLPASLFESE